MTDQTDTKRTYTRTPEVPFSTFDGDFEFEREPRKSNGPRRTEYQLELDTRVADAYESGKPLFLVVPATVEDVENIKKRVRNSVEYLQLGLKTGVVKQHPTTGDAVVSFLVVDRTERKRKPKAAE